MDCIEQAADGEEGNGNLLHANTVDWLEGSEES
jgi:hypothetical protein